MIIIILWLSLILSFVSSESWATVGVVKYPSGTSVQVCQASDTDPNCGVSSGGSQTPWIQDIDGAGYKLTNTGNVGIGTNASNHALVIGPPATHMSIDGTGITAINNVTVSYTDKNIEGSNNGAVTLENLSNGSSAHINIVGGTQANPWVNFVAPTNVGIGSVAPGATLDIQGTVRVSGVGLGFLVNPPYSTLNIDFTNNVVGIGTANPDINQGLDVQGPTAIHGGGFKFVYAGSNPFDIVDTFGNTLMGFGDGAYGATLIPNSITIGSPSSVHATGTFIYNNVGIGSANPGVNLDVQGTVRIIGPVSPQLDVQGTVRTQGFTLSGNGAAAGNVLVGNALGIGTWMAPSTIGAGSGSGANPAGSGSELQFRSNATTFGAVTPSAVDSNNNVGIGTVTPTALLNINSSVNQDLFRIDDAAGTDTTPFIVDATGNIGVGTATPSASLSISSVLNQALFRIDDNGTGDLSPFIVDANGNVGIGTANTETDKLLVMGGNVGIGTWVPSTILDVKGTVIISGNLGIGTITTAAALQIAASGDSFFGGNVGIGTLQVQTNALNVVGGMMIGTAAQTGRTAPVNGLSTTGNIGVGTWTNFNNLDVNGSIGAGTYGGQKQCDPSGVCVGGNVGIGTWAPTQPLSVANGGVSTFNVSATGAIASTLASATAITLSGLSPIVSCTNVTAATGCQYVGNASTTGFMSIKSTSANGTTDSIRFVGGNNGGSEGGRFQDNSGSMNLGIGSTAPGFSLDVNGTVRVIGLISRAGNNIKASLKTSANQACNTTCTSGGCLMGEDTSVLGSFVDCADATADRCICLDGAGG